MKKVMLPRMVATMIGDTVYIVENEFSKNATEGVKDKLKRLILNNIPTENAINNSQKPNK